MSKIFFIGCLALCVNMKISFAQTVDLSSVDEFLSIASALKEGKKVAEEQWDAFDNSVGYKKYAERENKFVINTIRASILMAFGKSDVAGKDSILNISKNEMAGDNKLMFRKQILANYLLMNEDFDSIKLFRDSYDFHAFVEKSKLKLFSFLGKTIDTSFRFKTVNFNCISADGRNEEDAIYLDFNLIYKLTEEQRINFLAHEFFHNYREKYENHDFNYKCDLNSGIDMIQNEGIADMIDKTRGYKQYYVYMSEAPEMAEVMVDLYNQAQGDMEKLQRLILKYAKGEIPEKEMIDNWLEIVKYNGHPIGFFMANQIVEAGHKNRMLATFYNPYEFFSLYNEAAKKMNLFQFSNEFMDYLNDLTKEYYRS
jgi:hypothetical protein